jgi:hypothetical protein
VVLERLDSQAKLKRHKNNFDTHESHDERKVKSPMNEKALFCINWIHF